MDIEVAGKLGLAVKYVADKMKEADGALDDYIVALGEMFAAGGHAAGMSGTPSCLLSPVAQSHIARAIGYAALAQAAHTEARRALHADGDRLAALDPGTPGDPVPQSGGGGNKIPPTP